MTAAAELAELLPYLTAAERQEVDALIARRPRFAEWLPVVSPRFTWSWPHLRIVQDALERITRGEITRLGIFMPPRHGKTEQATIRYPVYRLEQNPRMRVILAAYSHALAAKFSRRARAIAAGRLALSSERTAADDWETATGGGVRAIGVGTGVTGTGADLIVIDDPVKSREEAESPIYRERVWEWYTDDLFTRREPGCAIILQVTRWNEDDLAGRILASEDGPNWEWIVLPALAEADDPLARPEGAALCPERFDEVALQAIRSVLGEYSFSALYQQRPRPRIGNMFPRAKVTIVDAAPAGLRWIRYWDKAGSATKRGDFTAGVKLAIADDGIIYIGNVVRVQMSSSDRNALMRQTTELDGPDCAVWVEQEPGSGGKESAEASVKLLVGYSVRTETVTGDKVTRADPFAAQWQAGNVRLVRGDWNKVYLDELEAFPTGAHDDQVDASSGAINKLSKSTTGIIEFYAQEVAAMKGGNKPATEKAP